MSVYQHRFDNVEDYLHHREPYLMVSRISSIAEGTIETEKDVVESDFFISGHFPGAAIFPGAMMQELMTQSAGILIAANFNPMQEFNTSDPFFNEYALGVLVRVKNARYRTFARPGDTIRARVELVEQISSVFDFRGVATVDGNKIMQIEFQLANIKSSVLQGASRDTCQTQGQG